MSGTTTTFYGAVINPKSLTSYAALPRCLLAVGPTGNIDWIVKDVAPHELQDALAQKGHVDIASANLVELKEGEFLMPGFVDTHTHAPQVPNIGTGQEYELLDWLKNVTFPMESKFADIEFAKRIYTKVVRDFIDNGTTTCCYYATLHLESTKVLADIVHAAGQRGFIGKCNMNHDSPSYYIEPSPEASIEATKSLITYVRSLPPSSHPHASSGTAQPLVQPILTPRFAISCTAPLLSSLGTLASSDPSLLIQTHISENLGEIAYTKELFPQAKNYAGVYDMYGLLREGTILAHAVHLEEEEVELVKVRGAGVSHCPTSNFNIRSGVAPIGKYLDRGIKVGLGTDVSGGYSNSILTEIRHASMASKVLQFSSSPKPESSGSSSTTNGTTPKFENKQLPIPTLLYLATLGGASLCKLDSHIGSFEPGKAFDALLVSPSSRSIGLWGLNENVDSGAVEAEEDENVKARKRLEERLERFLFCGDDRNIERVYVQGVLVGGVGSGKRARSSELPN
ncbi:guanine deaminase [Coprinopsis cinerea okayama7|uniref:Guanine deaminase n=1 Tax=Coprinopsis cinerea (strain Okayama-7 / 130 / ATCC MYA-4618 / FGSC 9003) TaxID=240176 RepID=A8NE81_COPC7|nr:guanine deaminase [Coprinopsis cinerea okayama7\|eukprot:XP_001832956.1 guanine deaminase [Coprinopsis cinerea okayama7\